MIVVVVVVVVSISNNKIFVSRGYVAPRGYVSGDELYNIVLHFEKQLMRARR